MQLDRFINRPVLSTVISVLIVILGVLGLISLPITQYPDMAPPTIQVSTTYQGANAQTVLNSVIAPLEEQINGVENMDYMSSTATNTGSASITITFKQGTDPDMAAVNVQNRVSKAQGFLPAEVTRVGVITQKRQTSMLIIFSIVDQEDKYDYTFIENYAKINLIPQVQRVKGVGDANVMGADYSMRIWLNPEKMAEYHLVPTDISGILAEQNIEAAPGSIGERENQTFQYTLRYKGRLQEPSEFENLVIKSLADGTVLRLKDVAKVELGRVTYGFSCRVNGHNAVTCMVMQTAGSNATQIIKDIEVLLEQCEKDLPDGLVINVAQNANDFLFASIHEVIKTLIEAFILVFLVVFIFLQDFRSTLIPAKETGNDVLSVNHLQIGYDTVLSEITFEMKKGEKIAVLGDNGTGKSTFLRCLNMLEKYVKNGDTIADVGCGSGILAMCAIMEGAKTADAVDNDETAVITARENAEKNNLKINFQTATIDVLKDKTYDFVAANILHNVLRDIMPDIKRILKIGGKAVLSGILDEKAEIVYDALVKNNLKILEKTQEKEWVAFVAERED